MQSTSVKTQPMDESLEFIFTSMMHQGEIPEAIDFLLSIHTHYIPSKAVMQTLIFQILMKYDDFRCLAKVGSYLLNVLKVYPPCDEESRQFYLDSIQESNGFLADLWNVFGHIVNSYFCHHKIYIMNDECGLDVVKYPNCKYLLDLYIKIFLADYQHVTHESCKSSLLKDLLWPGVDTFRTSRCQKILNWINDIYTPFNNNQWASLLRNMHQLLDLVVKYVIHKKHDLVEVAAFNDSSLADIVEDIANFCNNAFSNLENVKLFLSFVSLKCLQARVSEKVIRMITKQNNRPFCVLTLKEIVNQHMFASKFNKRKILKPSNCKEKNLRKRTGDKSVEKKSKMETTALHQLCKENKFGDMILVLKTSYEKINARDHSMATPLHIACQAGNDWCVKVLIEEAGKGPIPKLDFAAVDNEGLTPLHIAVTSNNTVIAKMLLEAGGSDLLNATDYNDRHPYDLECSIEMEKLLKIYLTETNAKELDTFVENSQIKVAPVLKSFKEYSIYLQALTCLICGYSHLFQLFHLAFKKKTFTQDHSEKLCSHFVNDNFACSEDAALLPELPNLISTFIISLDNHVSKLNINIDLELLPLKTFRNQIAGSDSEQFHL